MVRKDQKILIKQNTPKKSKLETDPYKKPTKKQSLFIKEYMVDRNQTKAAIRAGFSMNRASATGAELVAKSNIKRLIDIEIENQNIRLEISADRTILEISRLATFDPRRMYDADGRLLTIPELDDDTAACIGGMKQTTIYPKAAHLEKKIVTEYTINNKGQALNMLKEIQKLADVTADLNPAESIEIQFVTKSARRREREVA